MKKLKIITIFSFLFLYFKLSSQTSLAFTYDAAGNLIQRNVVIMFQKPGGDFINPFSTSEQKNDSSMVLQFNVFPNPTKDILFIEGELPEENETADLFLFNSMGQLMYKDYYSGSSKQLNIRELKSGLYYLEVKYSKEHSSNYKIIINN
ncbi:MAG: T9SS type A sorting domain-containing protein [Sphingobacteriaceae bacterium]|nr:T9SS type A sorting domain-containing protein [Sphingobacteriaceae bacterium]